MRELLGGKGANLAEMTNLGLPCSSGASQSQQRPAHSIMRTEKRLTTKFRLRLWSTSLRWKKSQARNSCDRENPLLVSVRSGARASMPGMMDTILNHGLNGDCSRGNR